MRPHKVWNDDGTNDIDLIVAIDDEASYLWIVSRNLVIKNKIDKFKKIVTMPV